MTDEPTFRPRLRHLPWAVIGIICVALGFIGVLLPVLPTTPFLIPAAFAFSKSSPRMHRWLLEHDIFGGPIRDWEAYGAIKPRFKVIACTAMTGVFMVSLLSGLSATILTIQALAMGAGAAFVLTRPNGP